MNRNISSRYYYWCFIVYADINSIYEHSPNNKEQKKYIGIYANELKKAMNPIIV